MRFWLEILTAVRAVIDGVMVSRWLIGNKVAGGLVGSPGLTSFNPLSQRVNEEMWCHVARCCLKSFCETESAGVR